MTLQRIGRSNTVPRITSVPSSRVTPLATPPRLPGLNGRSVRHLSDIHAVRTLRRAFVTSIAVIAFLIAASVTVPAYAQAAAAPPPPPPPQVLSVSPTAVITAVERDGYSVTAPPPVQWPTVQHTQISDGFGSRVPPCDGCSSFHAGVDFIAGWGAEVHAMAAGVVVEVNDPMYSSLGNHLMIQHSIDGHVVTTVYGHMQYGVTSLSVGDPVKVGQVIGLVGSTGASTGPHLHFEIRVDDSPVSPTDWLYAEIG